MIVSSIGPHKSRKNSCSSITTQRIKTRFVPLRWRGPVHPNDTGIVSLMCSLGCPQRKTTKIYCPIIEVATPQHFSDTLQHPRQQWWQLSGVQQQGLVAPRWCKNLAERCFREGTGNDVRKYITRSRLSNVSDCYNKSLLRKRELTLELHFSVVRFSGPSLRFRGITNYLRGLFLRVRVSDQWWCPSTDRLLYYVIFPTLNFFLTPIMQDWYGTTTSAFLFNPWKIPKRLSVLVRSQFGYFLKKAHPT